jgi:hypothetical protein
MKDRITSKERLKGLAKEELPAPAWKEAAAGLLILAGFVAFAYVATHKIEIFGVVL